MISSRLVTEAQNPVVWSIFVWLVWQSFVLSSVSSVLQTHRIQCVSQTWHYFLSANLNRPCASWYSVRPRQDHWGDAAAFRWFSRSLGSLLQNLKCSQRKFFLGLGCSPTKTRMKVASASRGTRTGASTTVALSVARGAVRERLHLPSGSSFRIPANRVSVSVRETSYAALCAHFLNFWNLLFCDSVFFPTTPLCQPIPPGRSFSTILLCCAEILKSNVHEIFFTVIITLLVNFEITFPYFL